MGDGSGNLIEPRYERKLVAAGREREWVQTLVRTHPAGLREIHPPRFINNVYLDTWRHTCYADHVEGISHRRKFRIRWYGDLDRRPEAPQFEIKARQGRLISKRVYPFRAAALDEWLTADGLAGAAKTSEIPETLREQTRTLTPAMVNRYRRLYYGTRDGRVRVTIDTDLSYFRAEPRPTGRRERYDDPAVVVEIKFAEHAAEAGHTVASQFPLPLDKKSKYVTGISLLNNER